MSKLENKRRRAAAMGVFVTTMRENKFSEEKAVTIYNPVAYRRPTHVYVYTMVSDSGNYMVYDKVSIERPFGGLSYRQAVQLAYMLAFRRKAF